jgi:hypothetical protein
LNVYHVYRRKIVKSLRRRGPFGTAWVALRIGLAHLSPARRAARRCRAAREAEFNAREAEFDRAHGVDTAGIVSPDTLDEVMGPHRDECHNYEGVDFILLRERIAALGIDFPQYTFIDLGCGKGRALLIAAQFPFRQVRGVESRQPCTPSPRKTSPSTAGRAAAATYERTWPTQRSGRSPTGRWSSSYTTRSLGP